MFITLRVASSRQANFVWTANTSLVIAHSAGATSADVRTELFLSFMDFAFPSLSYSPSYATEQSDAPPRRNRYKRYFSRD